MRRFLPAAILILVFSFPALAQTPATLSELAGDWTYAREASGHVYLDALVLAGSDDNVTGTTTFLDNGSEQNEIFRNFEVSTNGKIFFVAERPNGALARHEGEFTADGLSIRGSYNLGMGVGGAFVLSRAETGCPLLMSGRWKCHIQDPKGGPGRILEGALLGDTGGYFQGYLWGNDDFTHLIEGTVTPDGSLRFNVKDAENYTLQGVLAPEGETTMGLWSSDKGHEGTFTLTRSAD